MFDGSCVVEEEMMRNYKRPVSAALSTHLGPSVGAGRPCDAHIAGGRSVDIRESLI